MNPVQVHIIKFYILYTVFNTSIPAVIEAKIYHIMYKANVLLLLQDVAACHSFFH